MHRKHNAVRAFEKHRPNLNAASQNVNNYLQINIDQMPIPSALNEVPRTSLVVESHFGPLRPLDQTLEQRSSGDWNDKQVSSPLFSQTVREREQGESSRGQFTAYQSIFKN